MIDDMSLSKELPNIQSLDMIRSSHHNNNSNSLRNPTNLEILPPFMTSDNIFSPTGQFADIDLSQYNSPSFAAGHHLQSQ